MLPDAARDAPRAPRIGHTVKPEDWISDTRQRTHHTNFNPWMAASSIAAPFAFSSSRASVTPMIGAATYG